MSQAPSKSLSVVMHFANSIHVALYRASRGKFANEIANLPILLLTTRGRKSGKTHTNPVVFIKDGPNYLISASAGGMPWHPGWYFNLKNQPDAKIEVGDRPIDVRAEIAQGEERNRLYQVFKEASPNFVKYEKGTTRVIPVIRLVPR